MRSSTWSMENLMPIMLLSVYYPFDYSELGFGKEPTLQKRSYRFYLSRMENGKVTPTFLLLKYIARRKTTN